MITLKKSALYKRIFLFLFSVFMFACVDPIRPEYEFINDLIFIDAIASTYSDASFVKLNKSVVENGRNNNFFIEGATVSFVNSVTNEVVNLSQEDEVYLPPENFAVTEGETWELSITLPNGKRYISLPETVLAPTEITNIKATYNSELIYRDLSERYVPGHYISVDFNDPADVKNYYYWSFRSFERITSCKTCYNGIFRNGICVTNPQLTNRKDYYDYICESKCWRIRHSENVNIFSDEFSNGLVIEDLSIANILLYTNEDILVEIQQFSLSASSYKYYKVLKDILDNSGSFNAPPPAAFIGNVFNPDDEEEYVLGHFTAASTVTKSIFISRKDITEAPIDQPNSIQLEDCIEVCNPSDCPTGACSGVINTECVEGRNRTGVEPEGWIDE